MAGILEGMGEASRNRQRHPTPPILNFLDPSQRIKTIGEHLTPEEVNGDCMIVLDTSAWAQLGPMAEVLRRFPGRSSASIITSAKTNSGPSFF